MRNCSCIYPAEKACHNEEKHICAAPDTGIGIELSKFWHLRKVWTWQAQTASLPVF